MKKTAAVVLSIVFLIISFSGCTKKPENGSSGGSVVIAADKTPLLEKITAAEPMLYGGSSEQTRKYLAAGIDTARMHYDDDRCSEEQMANDIAVIDRALSLLAPMEAKTTPLRSVPDAPVASPSPDAAAQAYALTQSLSWQGVAAGKLSGFDGLKLWLKITAGSGQELSVTLTADGTDFTALLNAPAQEGFIYISFDEFAADADIYSAGELTALSVSCAEPVEGYIAEAALYTEILESYTSSATSVSTASSLSNDKFYKIIDEKTGYALTYGPAPSELNTRWEGSLVLTETYAALSFEQDTGDISQLWQFYKQSDGSYRIINKGSAFALASAAGLTVECQAINMNNAKQSWNVTAQGGRFAITYGDFYRLTSMRSKPVLKDGSATLKLVQYDYGAWNQVWSDEFNDGAIDRSVWNVTNGKTRADTEPIFYRDDPKNIYFENGNLVIKSIREEYNGYHATSACIDTDGKLGFSYGKFEIYARVPEGTWPAFWMMGMNGDWPENGEIDIMETGWIGDDPTADRKEKSTHVYGTLHWIDSYGKHMNKGYDFPLADGEKPSDGYHLYTVEWERDQLRIYFDGMQYVSLLINCDEMRWSFGDNPHYMILNTSISGPGNDLLYDDTPATSFYYIDYLRVYKRAGELPVAATDLGDYESDADVMSYTSARTTVCASSKDGSLVAAGGEGGIVQLISGETGSRIAELNTGVDIITALAFSPDGKQLAASGRFGKAVLIDVSGKTFEQTNIDNSGVYVDAMAYTADSKYLLTGGRNSKGLSELSRYINIFSSGGALEKSISVESDVRSLAASDDGRYFAAGLSDGSVGIYDAASFARLAVASGHTACVRGIDFSADGERLVSSDENGNIIIWNSASGKKLISMQNNSSAPVNTVYFSADGSRVLASSNSGCAKLFTAATGRLYSLMGGFDSIVRSAVYSPDGSRILVCSFDGKVKAYRSDGAFIGAINAAKDTSDSGRYAVSVAFAGNGIAVCALAPRASSLVVWDFTC